MQDGRLTIKMQMINKIKISKTSDRKVGSHSRIKTNKKCFIHDQLSKKKTKNTKSLFFFFVNRIGY